MVNKEVVIEAVLAALLIVMVYMAGLIVLDMVSYYTNPLSEPFCVCGDGF